MGSLIINSVGDSRTYSKFYVDALADLFECALHDDMELFYRVYSFAGINIANFNLPELENLVGITNRYIINLNLDSTCFDISQLSGIHAWQRVVRRNMPRSAYDSRENTGYFDALLYLISDEKAKLCDLMINEEDGFQRNDELRMEQFRKVVHELGEKTSHLTETESTGRCALFLLKHIGSLSNN